MTGPGRLGRASAPEGLGRARRSPGWIGLAVRLFPDGWRERYGTEFAALLESTRPSPRVLFDVLVAAVDAHVHPTGPRRRWPLMIERLRLSELAVFASWVVFVVAGLAFQRMTDGAPYAAISAAQPAVGGTVLAVIAGAVLSLGAVTVAGLPIAVAIARRALARRDWRGVGLLAVPPVALATWVGLTALLLAVGEPPAGDARRVVLFVVWAGLFVAAAVASTVAVSAAALEAEIDGALYRRAVGPAVVTAAAMAVAVAAVAVWGVALAIGSPATFWGSEGMFGGSTALTWLGVVAVMGVATAAALRSALRARRELAA